MLFRNVGNICKRTILKTLMSSPNKEDDLESVNVVLDCRNYSNNI